MKRWKAFVRGVCLDALLLGAGQAQVWAAGSGKTASVQVTFVGAELTENNHVGNEWETRLTVNGKELAEGDTVSLKLKDTDTFKLTAVAEEMDKYPDIGSTSAKVKVSSVGKSLVKKLAVRSTSDNWRSAPSIRGKDRSFHFHKFVPSNT